ncbi:putative O-glycosylation ligase, exosortase A system-associated [Massilia cavernae]|uniref:Putative O-glycosylation ligase, exosortase A system-associated n=1 Tax=Massilia cavernae TaxID=2320864 RepID=A0A418XU85_9BURK|nr:putative O-glycosylation ligase, exosortase A system-associated [Massilia cavernae]RJG16274.1 putative O-glycosylation ligase, exosortase A system-associated [Massilia cavernae]
MRDTLITLIVFGSLPFILKRPYIGVLMWVWVSVMNPHRLSWDFAYSFPFAAIVAGTTLIALLVTKEPKKLPATPIVVILFAFTAWMVVTTIFSMWPDESLVMLNRVWKIMLMTVVTMMLIKTKEQIHLLIWALVLSIGFFGTKGGLFTLLSGGNNIVWGPPGSYIEGNNEVALAFITSIPLMFYLYHMEAKKWVRWGLAAAMVLCAFAALGSYSRGALVGIVAMVFFLWLKSPKKMVTGAILVMLIPVAFMFMPEQWFTRMDSINTYEQDASAMGRINAWWMAYKLALDRPLVGGGFEIYNRIAFGLYAPVPDDVHAAHSIYFQALGEHGFVGLGLYILLAILTWRKASWIVRTTKGWDELKWAGSLARMIQVSMVGFAVGGAFLSLLYYDVPYYLIAIIVCTGALVEKALKERQLAARAVPAGSLAAGPGGGHALANQAGTAPRKGAHAA